MSLSPGQTLQVRIDDIAFGGEGVGHHESRVVFVPFVCVGESVEIELTEVKKRFARGRPRRVIEASSLRKEPPCPYFSTCGGCQYQHLAYGEQLRIKRKQVADLLQRIGELKEVGIEPVRPSPREFGYRNRIMVRSQYDKDRNAMSLGFLRWDGKRVLDIKQCPIADPLLNEKLEEIRANPPRKSGVKFTLRVFPDGWILPRDSFFQVNPFLAPAMIEVLRDRIRDAGSRYLVDAYCGVGFLSLQLAGVVDDFIGIEIDPRAVKAARANARARGRTGGKFVDAPTEKVFHQVAQRFPPDQTTVILDPPRRGCHADLIRWLNRIRPRQVLYASCHPATMARDLKLLCGGGPFHVVRVHPLDMFPQTQHIECITDLRVRPAPQSPAGEPGRFPPSPSLRPGEGGEAFEGNA